MAGNSDGHLSTDVLKGSRLCDSLRSWQDLPRRAAAALALSREHLLEEEEVHHLCPWPLALSPEPQPELGVAVYPKGNTH